MAVQPRKERVQEDLLNLYTYLKGEYHEDRARAQCHPTLRGKMHREQEILSALLSSQNTQQEETGCSPSLGSHADRSTSSLLGQKTHLSPHQHRGTYHGLVRSRYKLQAWRRLCPGDSSSPHQLCVPGQHSNTVLGLACSLHTAIVLFTCWWL